MFFGLAFCLPDPGSESSSLSSEAEEWGHGYVSFTTLLKCDLYFKKVILISQTGFSDISQTSIWKTRWKREDENTSPVCYVVV